MERRKEEETKNKDAYEKEWYGNRTTIEERKV
jgi:hypothetical protein